MDPHQTDPTAELRAWLDAGRVFAPEYHGGLSNHQPMALAALHRLGATAPRLRGFAEGYARHLEPPGEASPGTAHAARLVEALAQRGAHAVLRELLPTLLPGIGAAAFHGLIRSAYAEQSGHAGELAVALAYWSERALHLGPLPPRAGTLGVGDWVQRLDAQFGSWQPGDGLIFERMRDAARDPAFAAAVTALQIDGSTLAALSSAAAQRYLRTRDFTVLHLVTSCHALRVLLPYVGDTGAALRWFAQAWAAALIASATAPPAAAPATAMPSAADAPPWPAIVRRAVDADNEHTIKLVDSCREEAALGDDALYRRVAALATAG